MLYTKYLFFIGDFIYSHGFNIVSILITLLCLHMHLFPETHIHRPNHLLVISTRISNRNLKVNKSQIQPLINNPCKPVSLLGFVLINSIAIFRQKSTYFLRFLFFTSPPTIPSSNPLSHTLYEYLLSAFIIINIKPK